VDFDGLLSCVGFLLESRFVLVIKFATSSFYPSHSIFIINYVIKPY